jgi:polysaccharide biosynthesis protein PslH
MSAASSDSRPLLLFVSTRFLLPIDSGGKIRTTEILRGLKGGRFRVVLACPAEPEQLTSFSAELKELCDELAVWTPTKKWRSAIARMTGVFSELPIPVRSDRSGPGCALVEREMKRSAVTVFDFAHAAVLSPAKRSTPTVMFTHNIEAEIFKRHAAVASNVVMRALWKSQYRKMVAFEAGAVRDFDCAIAVSERDAEFFRQQYGVERVETIPTGVNLDYFKFGVPAGQNRVVFTGSMDWLANQDGIGFFLDEAWERIAAQVPDAKMLVVGRTPPSSLVERARRFGAHWQFTNWVPDVRPHVSGADVFVIPLRIGGGTRIKAFEAMAMGVPVVSTTIGIEGLPVKPEEHYLLADSAADFAAAVVKLLRDPNRAQSLAKTANAFVAANFSNSMVARRFEDICFRAMGSRPVGGVSQ